MTTDDLSILDAWNVGAPRSARAPDSGTINRTLLVETAGGSYALRAYRYGERAPVEREHAVIAHVRGLGLPAVGPLPLPGGATVLERAGRFYALFPRAPGIQLRRDELALGDIAAIGGFLAGVHRALRSFPAAQAARRPSAINRAATLAGIDALDATIRARPTLDDVDHRAIERLADRRAWIERSIDELLPDVSAIEQQTIHGDYQETNLFFQYGRVVAIIDWDQTYAAPRAWEVVRALHLVCRFEPARCRAFAGAYRERLPLDPAELDLVVRRYGLMRAHDLWLFKAIYREGNERLRRFVTAADGDMQTYVPIMDRWEQIRSVVMTK